MDDYIELLNERIKQQDRFIDLLRVRVSALEKVLCKNNPDFEKDLAEEFHLLKLDLDERLKNREEDSSE